MKEQIETVGVYFKKERETKPDNVVKHVYLKGREEEVDRKNDGLKFQKNV